MPNGVAVIILSRQLILGKLVGFVRRLMRCPLTLSLALVISRAMRSVVAESAVVKAEVATPLLPSSRPVAAIVVADSTLHRDMFVRVGCRHWG